jgi:hypothetical protein
LIGTLIVIYLAKAVIYLYKKRIFNQKVWGIQNLNPILSIDLML